jgi:O-antigen ligase
MTATMTPVTETPITSYADRTDPFLFKHIRTWWLLLALFIMADGGGMFVSQGAHPGVGYGVGGTTVDTSSGILLLMTGVTWVICAGLMVSHIGPTLQMMLRQKAVLSFGVLALLSTLWSQSPHLTFRKAAILCLYLLLAWFIAAYYPPRDQIRLFLALGVIMALGSIVWAVFLPQYGVHATGEWKGIFVQKNDFGGSIVYLFSGFPFSRDLGRHRLRNMAVLAILSLGLILLSNSITSLIMFAILLAVRILGPWITRARREAIPLIVYCAMIGIFMIPLFLVVVLPLMGRDLTFTGRTHSWALVFPMVLQHLWLGYGYQGFFVNALGEPDGIIVGSKMWGSAFSNVYLFSVDNGYIYILLQEGLVGLAALLTLLVVCARDFLKLFRGFSVPIEAYWYAGVIFATFVGGVTENAFWAPNKIDVLMFPVMCAGLANLARESISSSRQLVTFSGKPS